MESQIAQRGRAARPVHWLIPALVAGFVSVATVSVPAHLMPQEPAAARAETRSASPLNLNTATVEQLETLPGIGKSTAVRIVEYREKNGPFKRIEDLMNIKGIGEKSFLKLKPLISIGAARPDRPTA